MSNPMLQMSVITKALLGGVFSMLVVIPPVANRFGWGIGRERDKALIAAMNDCAPEFRNAQGRCITTSRSTYRSRSIFGGSYGHGK